MTDVLMPALSPTMIEGKIARWLVKEGDTVKSGMVLAEIETDKATMEVEAVDEGVLKSIVVPEGTENVAVNSLIAIIARDGENIIVGAQPFATPVAANGAPTAAPQASSAAVAAPVVASAAYDANAEIPAGAAFKTQTVREALRDAMAEEMRRDANVYLMGEEVAQYQGAYKVSQGLLDEFGEQRVIDTPITEHGFAGLAVGSAFAGLRPIVEFMTFNFSLQAMDHLLNSAAKTLYMSGGQLGCPIVFRGPNGAAARVGAQHSQDFSSWFAHIPGLKVVAPYSADDAKGLLKSAIRDPNPVIVLENEILYGRSFDVPVLDDYTVPIGKARVRRTGQHVTLVSYSISVGMALAAADALAQEGIEAEVIDLRSLRPIDYATVVQSVMKTNRCVTVEEGWPTCSIGSELAAYIGQHAFDYLDAPVLRVNGRDIPMPYAANLEKMTLPSVADVVSAAKTVCYRQ